MSVRNHPLTTTGARILLVDDNANGLAARKTILEELGHKVLTSTSGVDALEQFAAHRFDLVVTDYRMPRMDGLELIGRLRAQAPSLPIVLLSGFAETLGMSEASTGADVVLQKSANEVSHLVRAVSRLLRRKPVARKPPAAQAAVKVKRKTV
ncbi:MAG TPA: response regulator [Bryobacteraceae bacterium]|nr:response regulator [Bryobacteraceae bacterium]